MRRAGKGSLKDLASKYAVNPSTSTSVPQNDPISFGKPSAPPAVFDPPVTVEEKTRYSVYSELIETEKKYIADLRILEKAYLKVRFYSILFICLGEYNLILRTHIISLSCYRYTAFASGKYVRS